jgi:hypothetical protein
MTTNAARGEFIRSIPFDTKARKNFGRHLHAAMCARSMTSKQLALLAGVADPTLKTLAAGNVNNSVDRLSMYVIVGIADGLDINPNEVIGWTGNGTIVAQKHIEEARPKAQERSARYRAQAEADMRKHAATEKDPAPVHVTVVNPEPRFPQPTMPKPAPEVSIASVMLKLRGLTQDDLVIVDELLSGLVQ